MKSGNTFNFIDLCAGCGGLSLGLMNAGWEGLFAVEKEKDAYSTLHHNLVKDGVGGWFKWPEWLAREAISLESLISKHESNLKRHRGRIKLLAGGPPCQGFSSVGRRLAHDPRNQVFKNYVKLVEALQPKAVLMENVRGILHPFKGDPSPKKAEKQSIYADLIKTALDELDYEVWYAIVHSRDYGVPQTRPRFILVGIRREGRKHLAALRPFEILESLRPQFLKRKQLLSTPVTVKEAISDLCRNGNELEDCKESPRFKQGHYGIQTSAYQRLLHGSLNGALADSHRFAKHRAETETKFSWFLRNCDKGKKLDQEERGEYANKKHMLYILSPTHPAPTVTTLPDDLLHYSEPRILTVREMARLQSFPDWFEFKGKYTTGGDRRTKECPRYTQVGNAVPPLLAEVLGEMLMSLLRMADADKPPAPTVPSELPNRVTNINSGTKTFMTAAE
jgi:DNA (cytosine-5)-methyltransferase 1